MTETPSDVPERLLPLFPMTEQERKADVAVYEAYVSGRALQIFLHISDDANQIHDPNGKGLVQGLVLTTLLNAAISKWRPGALVQALTIRICLFWVGDDIRAELQALSDSLPTARTVMEAQVRVFKKK